MLSEYRYQPGIPPGKSRADSSGMSDGQGCPPWLKVVQNSLSTTVSKLVKLLHATLSPARDAAIVETTYKPAVFRAFRANTNLTPGC